jgi:uncharacterized SAM-binding protein YcdF (DUF218 family)
MTLLVAGSIFLLLVGLGFTSVPFWTWYRMAAKKAGIHRPPDYIVLLGGGGMPSESALMRTWYAARIANYFPRSKVIVALPGDSIDSLSSISLMKAELVMRGISPERIMFEDSGTNTRAQAQNIFDRILNIEQRISNNERIRHLSLVTFHSSLLLVTSPEHLYRASLTFIKAGFSKVDGVPAFDRAVESDISFSARKLGGRMFIPDVGTNITLRYQFWTQMNYELLVLREWTALGYYKLKGWI